MSHESTLILIKPDGVKRRLVGDIIGRFERAGFNIDEMAMRRVTVELAQAHYPSNEEWLAAVGEKSIADCRSRGVDPVTALGTNSALDVGKAIKERLTVYLTSGPVVVAVLSGNRVVETVRKLVGATIPTAAAPGTIRGDYASDSPDVAEAEGRPVNNLIHASGTVGEAEVEIALWFPKT